MATIANIPTALNDIRPETLMPWVGDVSRCIDNYKLAVRAEADHDLALLRSEATELAAVLAEFVDGHPCTDKTGSRALGVCATQDRARALLARREPR